VATSKFTPREVPNQVNQEVRHYLDDMLQQISVLLNDSIQPEDVSSLDIEETQITDGALLARVADNETISGNWSYTGTLTLSAATIVGLSSDDLSDVASIAMLDEAETVTGAWAFSSISLADNNQILFGTGNDYALTYDGNSLDFIPAAAADQINMTKASQLRIWDSTDADFIQIQCDLARGIIRMNAGNSQLLVTPGSGATRSGLVLHESALVTDDETITVDLHMDGGFVFIVANSTSNAETSEQGAFFYFSGTSMFDLNSGATLWSLGSGSNPDVDGDHNVWRSAVDTISIKNRRAASRYYSIYVFAGH
jgi:hypothetical protein